MIRTAAMQTAGRSSANFRARFPVTGWSCAGLVALALAATSFAPDLQAAQPQSSTETVIRFAKSRILVQPRAGLSEAELDKVLKAHGGRRIGHLSQINVHIVELPEKANEMAVVDALLRNPHIKFAELDRALEPNLSVNDPYYGNAWHLPKIGVPQAWDVKTGAGITIAILDTGVDSTHPDLAPQLVPGWNAYDNNSNTADVHGHGTKIAGIAAAAGNNAAGSAGVSFASRIMPIRVTDTSGYGYYSKMAAGITWAADNGAKVVNISFQGPSASSSVVSAAQYMRSKGGVVITASGNTGIVESYPPTDYITVVSATDSSNAVTSFSSYGDFVDLTAPGVSIFSTTRGGGYANVSGTSASSPIVAGVYALMMSANPALPPATLDNIVFTTALDVGTAGKDTKAGWGVVNASAATIKAVQSASIDSTAPSASITSPGAGSKVSGIVPINVNATDNVAVARVDLYVNGSLSVSDTVSPYGFSWDTTKLSDGSATLLARAYDAAGNAGSSASVSVTVANDTAPPQVAIQNPVNGAVLSGTVTIAATATDDKKVASLSLLIDGKEVAKVFGASLSYSWDTRMRGKKSTGTRSIQVTALDPAGNKGTKTISVTTK